MLFFFLESTNDNGLEGDETKQWERKWKFQDEK